MRKDTFIFQVHIFLKVAISLLYSVKNLTNMWFTMFFGGTLADINNLGI